MPKDSIAQTKLASLLGSHPRRYGEAEFMDSINVSVLVQTYRCFPCQATREMVYLMLNAIKGNVAPNDFFATTLMAYEKLLSKEAYPLFSKAFTAMTGLEAARENSKFLRFFEFLGHLRDPLTFLMMAGSQGNADNFAAQASGRGNSHQLVSAVLRAMLFDEKEEIPHSSYNPQRDDIRYFDVITPPKKEGEEAKPNDMAPPPKTLTARFAHGDDPDMVIRGVPGETILAIPSLEKNGAYLRVVSDGANLFISGAADDPETIVLISERLLWLERWYDYSRHPQDRVDATGIDLKLASRASFELKRTVVIPVGHMSPYTMAPWLDL